MQHDAFSGDTPSCPWRREVPLWISLGSSMSPRLGCYRHQDAPELAADNVSHLELGGSAMAKNLTVDLGEDRPGRLATACEALGSAKVNIDGLCEAGGQLHLLVASPAKAKKAIEKAGLRVAGEHDVIVRKVVNRPGQGGRVLRALADADINVEFAYIPRDSASSRKPFWRFRSES